MTRIKKRRIGKETYFYLEHSYREKGRVEKKERYLGKRLPGDLERVKKDFLYGINKERFFREFDSIKEEYIKQEKKMPDVISEKQKEIFMIRFTYDTNRIEGSRLTLRETSDLLEKGITPREKSISDTREAEAHLKVFHLMCEYEKDLSLQVILYWHKMLFKDTKPESAGRIRDYQVGISGSRFMPPSPPEVIPLLQEFFRWYQKSKKTLHPVEFAALAHLRFVTIHSFGDGNGRMSRLIMNFILNKYGFPMLNIPYEKRKGYYNALERAQTIQKESIFVQWFFRRFLKECGRLIEGR